MLRRPTAGHIIILLNAAAFCVTGAVGSLGCCWCSSDVCQSIAGPASL